MLGVLPWPQLLEPGSLEAGELRQGWGVGAGRMRQERVPGRRPVVSPAQHSSLGSDLKTVCCGVGGRDKGLGPGVQGSREGEEELWRWELRLRSGTGDAPYRQKLALTQTPCQPWLSGWRPWREEGTAPWGRFMSSGKAARPGHQFSGPAARLRPTLGLLCVDAAHRRAAGLPQARGDRPL